MLPTASESFAIKSLGFLKRRTESQFVFLRTIEEMICLFVISSSVKYEKHAIYFSCFGMQTRLSASKISFGRPKTSSLLVVVFGKMISLAPSRISFVPFSDFSSS